MAKCCLCEIEVNENTSATLFVDFYSKKYLLCEKCNQQFEILRKHRHSEVGERAKSYLISCSENVKNNQVYKVITNFIENNVIPSGKSEPYTPINYTPPPHSTSNAGTSVQGGRTVIEQQSNWILILQVIYQLAFWLVIGIGVVGFFYYILKEEVLTAFVVLIGFALVSMITFGTLIVFFNMAAEIHHISHTLDEIRRKK